MAQSQLEVRTKDGVMAVHLHSPDKPESPGPQPTVLLYPDAFGLRPVIDEIAERIASHGYLVAAPDVFYRSGAFPPFDPQKVWGDQGERERLMGIMKQANTAAVMGDIGSLLEALQGVPAARTDKVGIMGYCMGGRIAFAAAGTLPDRVAAAASFHGGRLVTDEPDSPHLLAAAIRAQLYFGVADNDGSCSPEMQGKLAAALGAAHLHYQIELNPGAQHGYAVPDMPVYDKAASERHYRRALALFAEALPRG